MADLATRRLDVLKRHVVDPRQQRALTASAQILVPNNNLRLHNYPWQDTLWDYYRDGVGAFKFGMRWHSQMMSRVRLVAALQRPTGEDPEPITEGPVSDAMLMFFNGISGQSEYLNDMDLQMQVAGEGYVVGKNIGPGMYEWFVKSTRELDVVSGKGKKNVTQLWRMQVDDSRWEVLPEDSYVFRQWFRDPEYSWRPDSPARGALKELKLIDLLERRLMSQSVSRLAMNGFLLYAQEITFPINPKFKDQPDPFVAELLDIAERAIDNPASALAALPLPIKLPSEHFDKFKHVPFSNPFDEKTMDILDGLYDKLSIAMNMPKEVITGMGSTSHWNAWTLSEEGIETHIKPDAEAYCRGLTTAYLHPWIRAAGLPTATSEGTYIVWYTTEKLDTQPNLAEAADSARDRHAISDDAYRNAKGFDETDAPNNEELAKQLLMDAVKTDPSILESVIKLVTSRDVIIVRDEPTDTTDVATPPAIEENNESQPTPPTASDNEA